MNELEIVDSTKQTPSCSITARIEEWPKDMMEPPNRMTWIKLKDVSETREFLKYSSKRRIRKDAAGI